ncbi:RcnB family protein, partial [Sphingomonas bacterium]|uniref:RcnB family protein n=1 Tax=Sphingomonas bacterium TaxID=1895847 RepID=UPI0020C5F43B
GGQPQGFRPDAGQRQGYQRDPNRGGGQAEDYRRNDGQPGRGFNGDPNRGAQPGYRGPQGGQGGYAPQAGGRGPGPQNRAEQGQFRGNGGGWNRGWRGDNRYDWGGYRAQNRSAFHLPRYYAPPSWRYGYRRFSPKFTLSVGLFDRGFWIDDAYAYRLPPAQWPYQWVRYYNDALLVDVRTGYVVDTVYDIFW